MNYKALITDFDNTLVGNSLVVDPAVHNAIATLHQSGIIFTLATGRPYYDRIDDICKEINIRCPVVTSGGSYIMDPHSEKPMWKVELSEDETKEIIRYLSDKNLYYCIEGVNCVYTPDGNRVPLYANDTVFKIVGPHSFEHVPKILIPAKVNKCTEVEANSIITDLTSLLKNIHPLKIKFDGHYGLDITSSKGTKHMGVLELMKILGLKKEEVVGAGDGYNDYPLLTACGIKVAMGDAPQELKSIADFIAPPQKENGLLTVIQRYFPSRF